MSAGETTALVRAPIVEVVCGVRFRPIPAFDTLRHGLFWSRIRDRYPRAEVHPMLTDPAARIVSDVPLQRTLFVSADDEFVIQVQFDRFYVNWRKRLQPYPRFYDPNRGVHDRFEREYDGFRVFLRDILNVAPAVVGIELSKVDVLQQPADWTDFADLGVMVPRLRSLLVDESPNVNVALAEPSENGGLQTVFRTLQGPGGPRLHAEFRVAAGVGEDASLDDAFRAANDRLNAAFFNEFPDAGRRFGSGVQ